MKIVQIGANVDVKNEPNDFMYNLIIKNNCSGILVDANPDAYEMMKLTYKDYNFIFENLAICDNDGDTIFYYEKYNNNPSSQGSLSITHELNHHHLIENIIKLPILGVKLNTLLDKYKYYNFDVLAIDAESLDCDIILSTNFSNLNIKEIIFEITNTDKNKLQKTFNYLNNNNYKLYNIIKGNAYFKNIINRT